MMGMNKGSTEVLIPSRLAFNNLLMYSSVVFTHVGR